MNSNTRESVVNELNTEENINFNDFKRVSNIIILILVTIFTINYKLPLIYIVKFLMNKIVNDILKYGIFKNIIGDGLPKPTDPYNLQKHYDNIKLCADTLWTKFNSETGTIIKIPNLKIIGYIISLDGCKLTELYKL